MPSPLVIPFFIPHLGCPRRCSFCNQAVITGRRDCAWPDPAEIEATIRKYLENRGDRGECQVAFYGGSFSGLEHTLQERLLASVTPFLADGRVDGIRISTRPDYLDRERLEFLKSRGVALVELGIQSLDDRVLAHCERGHNAADSLRALGLLREAGLRAGVQLMVGLPGETTAGILAGARQLAELRPETARLYPALVLRGSRLAADFAAGRYRPLGLAKSVALCARMREIFLARNVRVVRMGLQESDSLAGEVLAGPHHPAFGELVLSWCLHRRLRRVLANRGGGGRRLLLAAADRSVFAGAGNFCRESLRRKGLLEGVELVFVAARQRGEAELIGPDA